MKGQILEIIKKNLVSIICGVVALVAVGVALTMLSSDKAKLQTELDGRKQAYTQLSGLLTAERTLPTVDEKNAPPKLAKFPSQKIIDQGDAIVKELEKASKEIFDEAVKMNKHDPLQPGSLPAPTSPAALMFRERYQNYFPPQGVNPTQSQLARDLNAGMPPTGEELRLKVEERAAQIRKERLIRTIGGYDNTAQVEAEIQEMARKLPGQLRKQVAQSSRAYINPQTFQPYQPVVQAAGAPSAEDIYAAQLILWLQQDVVAAVNDANADSKSIADSTVKHLIRVTALPQPVMPPGGAPGGDADAALPKEPAVSPTARVTNGMYDVYHINVEADVDAARLPEFLRALGRNRFMTPLWADVKAVDLAVEQGHGHDYGMKPVVRVNTQCEVLYLRAWNLPLMPKEVKAKLGIGEDGAPVAAPADDAAGGAYPGAI